LLKRLTLVFSIAAGWMGADFDLNLPKGFPHPVVPTDNPMSAAKVELGRYVFYDKRMSMNGKKESCGKLPPAGTGLHRWRARPGKARPDSSIPRSSMSLVTVAYAPLLTWANPTLDSLEGQALIPMVSVEPIELGLKGHEQEFFNTLRSGPLYQRLRKSFREAADVYTLQNITKAIAAFERTIISMRFRYDRYRWGDDSSAISDSAKRDNFYSP
jgi:cytochrome c peroxidase